MFLVMDIGSNSIVITVVNENKFKGRNTTTTHNNNDTKLKAPHTNPKNYAIKNLNSLIVFETALNTGLYSIPANNILDTLKQNFIKIKNLLEQSSIYPDTIVSFGTEIFRKLQKKQKDFDIEVKIQKLLKQSFPLSNTKFKIISQKKELNYTKLAITSFYNDVECFFDVGGASTEGQIFNSIFMLDIGARKLKDLQQKTNKSYHDLLLPYIKKLEHPPKTKAYQPPKTAYISGGTISAYANYKQNNKNFDFKKIESFTIDINTLQNDINHLSKLSSDKLEHLFSFDPKREQTIIPGLIIIHSILSYFNINILTVTNLGARYGIIIENLMKIGNSLKTYSN